MSVLIRLLMLLLLVAGGATDAAAQEATKSEIETEMEETVVTATRTPVSIKDAPGAITVITADQLKDIPSNDILDMVRETAGITLIGRGVGGRTVISIRGLESRQTLILVDGNRVAASDATFGHSDFETNWIPLEAIERIEVARGPLSALYGSEAMGGVINIITKKATADWHGTVRAGGGMREDDGGENQSYAFLASGPILKEKLGLRLSGEYLRDEDTPDPDEPEYTELEGKEAKSVGTQLTFTPTDHHTFEAFFNYVRDDRWRDTTSRGNDYEDLYELDKVIYGLGWHGTIGPTRSSIKAYRSDIDKLSIKDYADGSTTDYPERLVNDAIDAQSSISIGNNLLTLGGELRREELESTSLLEEKDDVTYYALFIQDELPLFGDRLLLTPGVRWDDHESFGSEVSPRIYALWKVTEQINLKAGYGHAFRAPTVKQVSEGYYSTSGPHTFLGNPDVKPETSDAYEAGVEYFGKNIFARVMGFYNEIDDLIAWNQIGGTPGSRIYEATNVDEAETKGVETEVGVTLPYGFDVSLNYTYLDARDTGNDIRLDGKPRHTGNAKLKYTWASIGLSTALRWQYIADQVLYNADDELVDVPDYSLWHFSLRQRLLNHFEVQLGVENIGDVRLADKTDLYDYEKRGRFYYANLRYEF